MVLCNLKARNMRGIKSDGMLLCASNDTHELVEPLMPPGDVQPGERVAYGDDETATQPEPETPNKAGYCGVHVELCLSNNITLMHCTTRLIWLPNHLSTRAAVLSMLLHVLKTQLYLLVMTVNDLLQAGNSLIMQVQKKKIWEGVQPHLKTNDQRQVVYKGTVMTIGAGPVMAPTLANANIS